MRRCGEGRDLEHRLGAVFGLVAESSADAAAEGDNFCERARVLHAGGTGVQSTRCGADTGVGGGVSRKSVKITVDSPF